MTQATLRMVATLLTLVGVASVLLASPLDSGQPSSGPFGTDVLPQERERVALATIGPDEASGQPASEETLIEAEAVAVPDTDEWSHAEDVADGTTWVDEQGDYEGEDSSEGEEWLQAGWAETDGMTEESWSQE